MELKQLEAFVSVADNLSFSKAAEALFLTQPTISSHVATLEKELGVRLFNRTTKTLKLTEAGRKVYSYANRMIELRDTILMQTHEDSGVNISIGASTIPATYLLPVILAGFSAANPRVKYRIRQGNSCEVEEMVSDGAAEVGIIGQKPVNGSLEAELLCSDRIVLVTPVNEYYTGLKNSGADIERLLKEPIILREEGSGTQKAVDEFLNARSEAGNLNVVVRNNNQEAIKRMVAAGAGISVMSYYAAADMERQGTAYCYPLELEEERKFYIIYRKDRTKKPAVQALVTLAHEIYGQGG